MEPDAAASVAAREAAVLAKALESPQETDFVRLSCLADALGALAAHINPDAAPGVAHGLAKALESPQETNPNRLFDLGRALAALAARMNPDDAARVANGLAKVLNDAESAKADRLWSLGRALAALALAARMNPDAAAIAADGLAKALENSREMDSVRLWSLGKALAALAEQIPTARQTQLTVLSNLFLGNVPGPPKDGKGREDEAQDRTRIARICGSLDAKELAGVLKWPFCVGEAQNLVFAKLKEKREIGQTFDGDVWTFVKKVDSLGIGGLDRKFLEQPAKRP
jgi:hypothetical protein